MVAPDLSLSGRSTTRETSGLPNSRMWGASERASTQVCREAVAGSSPGKGGADCSSMTMGDEGNGHSPGWNGSTR